MSGKHIRDGPRHLRTGGTAPLVQVRNPCPLHTTPTPLRLYRSSVMIPILSILPLNNFGETYIPFMFQDGSLSSLNLFIIPSCWLIL